eukprot:s2433_g7.t1
MSHDISGKALFSGELQCVELGTSQVSWCDAGVKGNKQMLRWRLQCSWATDSRSARRRPRGRAFCCNMARCDRDLHGLEKSLTLAFESRILRPFFCSFLCDGNARFEFAMASICRVCVKKRSDFLWGCAGAQLPCLWRRDPENRPNEVIPSCHLPRGRSCRPVLKMFQAYCLLLSHNLHNPRE